MICPNCNKEIADGSSICSGCGSNLLATNYATSTSPDTPAKSRGLSKKQYLDTEAPEAIRKASKICLMIFGALAVLILIASFVFGSTSIFNLPFMQMVAEEIDLDDTKEIMDKLADDFDEIEEEFEDVKEDLTEKDKKIATKFMKAAKNMIRKVSISSIIAVEKPFENMKKLDDIDDKDLDEITDAYEDLSEALSLLKAIRNIVFIIGIVAILLLFVGAFFKRTGFIVFSTITYVPFCMLVINVLLGVVIFVGCIALAVFTSKINKAWKKGA